MSTTTQSPKPKRRWLQFSLKTLLIVITVATVTLGIWVQYRRNRAQQNRDSVEAFKIKVAELEELGGFVYIDYGEFVSTKLSGDPVLTDYEARRPQTWLESQFNDPGDPDDPVRVLKVVGVDFEYAGVNSDYDYISDADLEHLQGLSDLKFLRLTDSDVSDDGLKHLSGMNELQVLWLTATQVTDAGLERLKALKNLRYINLMGTAVTAEGVRKLQQALPECNINY